ncbi:unnamed protein product [Vitrella brassicaformis CCMP3155]|uniref:Methyltransferase domain-containing protein n=1 Tax=Vitrella brassicaformis (strain CCMP3155) TaxID=1169540 RepID=A0A0G4EJ92_VITBC|nr:unnamed protein product [Vitrella brassicaformis CCMP3155]|eukprot:CEL97083.1 unnamed protein product [Vitrella brassicaformis CCMP3155]
MLDARHGVTLTAAALGFISALWWLGRSDTAVSRFQQRNAMFNSSHSPSLDSVVAKVVKGSQGWYGLDDFIPAGLEAAGQPSLLAAHMQSLWERMKALQRFHSSNADNSSSEGLIPSTAKKDCSRLQELATLWMFNFHPSWTCSFIESMGDNGDGGKWVCDPDKIPRRNAAKGQRSPPCLVYSVGGKNEWGFEAAIVERLGCEVHTFDYSLAELRNKPDGVEFHPWKLSAPGDDYQVNVGEGQAYSVKGLPEIIKTLGHRKRQIDILKVDVEGDEFRALLPLLERRSLPPITQVGMF